MAPNGDNIHRSERKYGKSSSRKPDGAKFGKRSRSRQPQLHGASCRLVLADGNEMWYTKVPADFLRR